MKHAFCIGLVFATLFAGRGWAHAFQPALLQVAIIDSQHYQLTWKLPLQQGKPYPLRVELPAACSASGQPLMRRLGAFVLRDQRVLCTTRGPFEWTLGGFDTLPVQVLVRVERDGRMLYQALHDRERPVLTLAGDRGSRQALPTFFTLGVRHILSGVDHLLFVWGLLQLAVSWRKLVMTITAFTLAHSLTLAGAVLGWVQLPVKPVEAVIALSIVFLAVELKRPEQDSWLRRQPWLAAMAFGLLHGFGFAGALAEVDLSGQVLAPALLSFNLGVEAGQLLFVLLVLAAGRLVRPWVGMRDRLRPVPVYLMGSLASFWLIQRVSLFWEG